MEVLGIVLSVPAAFLANLVYCFLLSRIVVRVEMLRRLMWRVSIGVLAAFAIELTLLSTLGPVRARAVLGPGFYVGHMMLFFLGSPALANVLVLYKGRRPPVAWYAAVPFCTIFAFVLVLLQYSVSEALYGIDGTDGPFS
jgi:hypothetical protein